MSETPSLNGTGRDSGGRFTKGYVGGPGNPFARKANELRAALYAAATKEDMADMVRALIEKVKAKGDAYAASVIFDRLFGKAPQAIELSGPDGEPLQIQTSNFKDWSDEKLATFKTMLIQATARNDNRN